MARLPLFSVAAVSALLLAGQAGCLLPDRDSSTPAISVGHGHGPPAHGYRKKRLYLYYPSADVYYDVGRSSYFYVEGGEWKVVFSLPSSVEINLREAISLELDTDEPYTAEHPGKGKAKGKKKY